MTPPHRGFVSCDWGTTNLRLRYVEAETGHIVGGVALAEGVKHTHEQWRERGGERAAVYGEVLERGLAGLRAQIGAPLERAVVLVSGMASSSVGLVELPCAGLPFSLRGEDVVFRVLETPLAGGQRVVLVSGVRSEHDVMRGEETQLIGLWQHLHEHNAPAVLVLPGTHSKHVWLDGSHMRDFRTHMTGELFATIAEHTILRDSVRRLEEPAGDWHPAFAAGVSAAADMPLLAALFRTRTNELFEYWDPAANFWYLSGVLIGTELLALREHPEHRIVLCAGKDLRAPYQAALGVLGFGERVHSVPADLVDQSAARGHLALLRRLPPDLLAA